VFSQQIVKGKISAFFPLHNLKRLEAVKQEWLKPSTYPWDQPLFLIKVTHPMPPKYCSCGVFPCLQEYFGEKLGLYFAFMGHFNKWLLLPAVIGVPLQIYILAINDFSNPSQVGLLPSAPFPVAIAVTCDMDDV
jgi:hypothetical protein